MATSTNTPCYGKCPAEVRLQLNLQEQRLSPHDGQVTRRMQKQGRAPVPDANAAVILPHDPRRKWMMTKEEQFWKMSGQSFSIGMLFCLYIRLPHLRTTLWSPCQERGSWFVIDLTSLLTGRHESRTHGVAANTHMQEGRLCLQSLQVAENRMDAIFLTNNQNWQLARSSVDIRQMIKMECTGPQQRRRLLARANGNWSVHE